MISTQQNNPSVEWRCDICELSEDKCQCYCACGTLLIDDEEKDTKICRWCK